MKNKRDSDWTMILTSAGYVGLWYELLEHFQTVFFIGFGHM